MSDPIGIAGEAFPVTFRRASPKESFADGDVYEGAWVAGDYHGHGKYSFASGEVYVGEYAKNKQQGKGKMTYAGGNSYDGEWSDGKRHGIGTYSFAKGTVKVGRYEADANVGQGVKWSADRKQAWELQAGKVGCGIPLDEAAKIAERIGLPPP